MYSGCPLVAFGAPPLPEEGLYKRGVSHSTADTHRGLQSCIRKDPIMKSNQLIVLFTKLSGTDKCIRYGHLMSNGFHSGSIDIAVKETGATLSMDSDGYTIIKF